VKHARWGERLSETVANWWGVRHNLLLGQAGSRLVALTDAEGLGFPVMSLNKTDIRKIRKRRARLKKKLTCRFCPDGVIPRPVYVDYKDIKTLKQLVDRGNRILPRRRTGTSAIYQRAVRKAVMRARFIALLPYIGDD
jgi:small subunit ribosomal protein S18